MRATIKIEQNSERIQENKNLRMNALSYNLHNPYSNVRIPKRIKPRYEETYLSFKVHSVVAYMVEPTEIKDMLIDISQYGTIRAKYDPLLEQKLELYFNGE